MIVYTLVQLSSSIAEQLFQLFDGRSGNKIAPNGELIRAFSMVSVAINRQQLFMTNFKLFPKACSMWQCAY